VGIVGEDHLARQGPDQHHPGSVRGAPERHFIEVLDDVRDDAFLAHVETLGEQLRMGRALYPDEIDPKDFVLSRTGPVRGNFLRTLVNAINLYNETGVGGTPLSDIVRA